MHTQNQHLLKNMINKPEIIEENANRKFFLKATSLDLNPNDKWVGGYVDYEWEHGRYIFERPECNVKNNNVLEFGCNMGATSIILAQLGAKVTAIDINEDYLELAKLNAERYGLIDNINFILSNDTTKLDINDNFFDYICCNSVLEYIPKNILKTILIEIDRVLKVGGVFYIMGTSNILSPKEVHSNKWLINYLPYMFDRILFGTNSPERGISPFKLLKYLPNYINIDAENNDQAYLETQNIIGCSRLKMIILRSIGFFANLFKHSIGMYTPNIFLALKKFLII